MTKSSAVKSPIQIFARMAGRITLILISTLIACTLVLVGVLFTMDPGKPKPFLDKNGKVIVGSISEKIYVNINGVKQGMFIESKNNNNPVL